MSVGLHPVNRYIAGRPHGICDRCGFRYRLDELRTEWSGALVCPADFDPPPRDMCPPRLVIEGAPIPNARPDIRIHDLIVDSDGMPIADSDLSALEED